jgi:hypothetical protein
MKRVFVWLIAAACVTAACDDSEQPVQPSSVPSAARPGNSTPLGSNRSPQSGNDSPSTCTSTSNEPCAGGVESDPPQERSCSTITNGIEVVVSGSRQSNGTVRADHVAQVPPGTQPAPPGGEVVMSPGTGDGSYSVAHGDALGPVDHIRGRCPDLTFTVGGDPVATHQSTKYFGLPSEARPRR